MGRVFRLFEAHAAEWDAEFRRVRDEFHGRMQCQRGCSMCCSQMFSISPLEAAAIAETVAALPEPDRERLRSRARAYLEGAARLGVVLEPNGEPSVSPRVGLRLPCPALQDDACSIYAARPIICRKWGIPVFDPSKPDRLHACELNFRAGESIDAGDLVDRQAALLERWVALKDATRSGTASPGRTWTIAEAILAEPASGDG
jgi:Fe-S-cluster containining protein